MKHHFLPILTIFVLSSLSVSCSDEKSEPEPIIDPVEEAFDLSSEEMANCYIVTQPGFYKFIADNQFNLGPGLPVPPTIEPVSASLVWQTQQGSIDFVELSFADDKPLIVFEVSKAEGNAIIAACDDSGNILWSWHIWMPQEEISSFTTDTGYEVMNMNLGAMNNNPSDPLAYGMLYQWGRKDPFPASPTLTGTTSTVSAPMFDINDIPVNITNSSWNSSDANTLEYAIAHPTVCLSNYARYATSRDWLTEQDANDALWGNPEGDVRDPLTNTFPNKGKKTCYDPSPAGWRVPPADVFRNFSSTGGYVWTFDDFNVYDYNADGKINLNDYTYGWHFMTDADTPLFFPAAARFDGSYAMLMGSVSGLWGNYWSNAPYSTMAGGAFCALAFQIEDQNGNTMITLSPAAASSRADAFSIRCIRDN